MHKKSPSKIWRNSQHKYRLVGNKSKNTHKDYYPPVKVVPGTIDSNFEYQELPEKGKLVTWSIVRVAPNGFEGNVPYVIAIIELENGERLTSQVVDIEDFDKLNKGDALYPSFRKIYEDGKDGVIHYGLKWSR